MGLQSNHLSRKLDLTLSEILMEILPVLKYIYQEVSVTKNRVLQPKYDDEMYLVGRVQRLH